MTPEERAEYEKLMAQGYSAHRKAHEIFLRAVDRWQAERKGAQS